MEANFRTRFIPFQWPCFCLATRSFSSRRMEAGPPCLPFRWLLLLSECDVYISQPELHYKYSTTRYFVSSHLLFPFRVRRILSLAEIPISHHGARVSSASRVSWICCCPFKGRMADSIDLPASYRPLCSNRRKHGGLQ